MHLCVYSFLICTVFRIGIWTWAANPESFRYFLLARGGEMAAGAWLALAWRGDEWPRVVKAARWLAPIGFGLFAIVSVVAGTAGEEAPLQMLWGLPSITIGFSALLVLVLEKGFFNSLFDTGWLRHFGKISYGLYVYQGLFGVWYQVLGQKITGQVHAAKWSLAVFVIACVCTLLVSELSFTYFEKPFLRYKRHFAN